VTGALWDDGDAALDSPRERDDARRAIVRLGDRGEEFVSEDDLLYVAASATQCTSVLVSELIVSRGVLLGALMPSS
jgi:hypothetical protein